MRWLWLWALPVVLAAQMLQVGDRIAPRNIDDQFGHPRTLAPRQWLVVTWDRASTHEANVFFDRHPVLLENNSTALLVDVSTIPEGIYTMFVLPRLQAYRHPMLLSHDEAFNASLPYREGSVTLLTLQGGTITAIAYLEARSALHDFFSGVLPLPSPAAAP